MSERSSPGNEDRCRPPRALSERPGGKRRRLVWAGVAACVALHLTFICQGVTRPWLDDFDGINGSLFSVGARNTVRYGLLATRFGCALDSGRDGRPPTAYYIGHPPLLPLMVAGSFKVFGVHEWAARMVPITFSALAVILVFLNAARVMGPAASLSAAATYAVLPMTGAYGAMVCHESPTTSLVLLAMWQAHGYLVLGGTVRLVGTIAALTAAQLADWPGFFAAAGVVAAAAAMARREARHGLRLALLAALAGGAVFVLVIGHLALLSSGEATLLEKFAFHAAFSERSFAPLEFLVRQVRRTVIFFTPTALGLASLGLFMGLRRPGSRAWGLPVAALAVPAALHVLVFPHGAWYHHYWLYYFGPPLALLCGLAVERCMAASPVRRRRGLTAVCLLLMVGTLPLSVLAVRNLHGRPSMDDYREVMQLRQVVGPGVRYGTIATYAMVPYYMDGIYWNAWDARAPAIHLRDLPRPQFVAVHPSHVDWAEPMLSRAGYERDHRWKAYRTVFYFATADARASEVSEASGERGRN